MMVLLLFMYIKVFKNGCVMMFGKVVFVFIVLIFCCKEVKRIGLEIVFNMNVLWILKIYKNFVKNI